MKPCKRGIKIWSKCDASYGYLCQFEVYTGKKDEENDASAPPDQCGPFKGLSARVVYNLTRSLSGKNYMVFMDNFFSSIDLFLKLFEEQIFCCGTVRENRKGFPPALKGVKLVNQGDSKFARFQNLVCTVWKDKAKSKNVALLSTQFNPNQFEKVERRKKNPGRNSGFTKIMIDKPKAISHYNKHMGGVDIHDQAHRYYNVTLKSVKWWKYLFFFFFDACIINSYVLYKENLDSYGEPKRLSHLEFRLLLSKQLIGEFSARRKRGRPSVEPSSETDHGFAFGKVGEKRGYCKNCVRKNNNLRKANRHSEIRRPKETVFGCTTCGVHLHKGDCFKEWHKNL